MSQPTYVIIADPASLRWQHYERDLTAFWSARSVSPNVSVLSWAKLLDTPNVSSQFGELDASGNATPVSFRIESPGRDKLLIDRFLQLGFSTEFSEDARIEPWFSPHRVHTGLRTVMERIADALRERPSWVPSQNLRDLINLFDKNLVSRLLLEHEIPTPVAFSVQSTAELVAELRKRSWRHAYVKYAYGSCASGVAYVTLTDFGCYVVTTVVEQNGSPVPVIPPRSLRGDDATNALKLLIQDKATVQQAIDKACIHARNFDLRVIVIGGSVAATILRLSDYPMTNLHLGGDRGDLELCRRHVPDRAWADAMAICLEAAELFDLPAVGIDLAFERATFQPFVIEVNSFGDFFPNWINDQGLTVYSQEIARTAERMGWL